MRVACVVLGIFSIACNSAPVDPAEHCPSQGEIECATDIGGLVPYRATGSTAGAEDGYSGSRCGLGGGVAVEDAAFRWTSPRAGFYRFDTAGSSFDTILSVRQGSCAGREIVCNDNVAEGSTHSAITLELSECETITLVVDGFDGSGVGPFALSIDVSEVVCNDGSDDDGDGLVDCADPDCAGPRCDVNLGDWPEAWATNEEGVIDAVNAVRIAGTVCDGETMPPVPALEMDELLMLAARLHSLDMAEQSYFSHDSLDGRTLNDRVADTGWAGAAPLGENIAAGHSTVEDVMSGWLSSPGHCLNIMNPAYHVIGVGFAEGAGGTRWTQDFAGSH